MSEYELAGPVGASAHDPGQLGYPSNDDSPSSTGHPAVDDVVSNLDAVRDLPPAEQVRPLADAQRVLQSTLDSIGDI